MSRVIYSAMLAASAMIASGGPAQAKDLSSVVKDAGYRLYQPPREDWGPGTVLLGSVSGSKLKVERAICPSLFSSVAPHSTGVVLQDYSGTSTTDLNLGIGLLDKVVGPTNSANLKASYKAPRNVSIKWGAVTEKAYFASDAFTSAGQTADLNPACRAAINDLRRRGQLKRAFVVDRAISTDSLNYTFKRGDDTNPSGGSVGGDLKISGLVTVTASAGYTVKDQTTLVINKPIYVGYARPARLEEFVPLPAVSGSRVRVVVHKAAADLVVE